MKKILFMTSVVVTLALTINYFAKKEGKFYSGKTKNNSHLIQTTEVGAVIKEEIEEFVNSESIPSIEELETELIKKSDKELEAAIEDNNSWASKKQFIAKANTNSLSKQDSAEFLKFVRLNSALHKILLERQLDAFEQETL